MGALSIRNVRKSFGAVDILKGIDIEVEAGEFLILVGPSGCGKSTLLNMIAGLETPSTGSIHIAERNVTYALHDSHVADLLDQAVFHVEHLRLGLVERQERAS